MSKQKRCLFERRGGLWYCVRGDPSDSQFRRIAEYIGIYGGVIKDARL